MLNPKSEVVHFARFTSEHIDEMSAGYLELAVLSDVGGRGTQAQTDHYYCKCSAAIETLAAAHRAVRDGGRLWRAHLPSWRLQPCCWLFASFATAKQVEPSQSEPRDARQTPFAVENDVESQIQGCESLRGRCVPLPFHVRLLSRIALCTVAKVSRAAWAPVNPRLEEPPPQTPG